LRPDRTSVSIDGVVDQALGSLRGVLEEQEISLERKADASVPAIQADELQIEQAVYNVLKNAVEAMPGGGKLRVVTAWDQAEGRVRISIEDTGPGIQPEDRERIFHAFFTTKRQGTGLGLSIVEGVLKNHGGSIKVDQPGDQGTRITLSFPAREGRHYLRESGEHGGSRPEQPKDAADPGSSSRPPRRS